MLRPEFCCCPYHHHVHLTISQLELELLSEKRIIMPPSPTPEQIRMLLH
jgi:hypothetical protein